MSMTLQIDRKVPIPAPRSNQLEGTTARLSRQMEVGDRVIVPSKKIANSLINAIKSTSGGRYRALQRRIDEENISVWKVKAVKDSDSKFSYSISA